MLTAAGPIGAQIPGRSGVGMTSVVVSQTAVQFQKGILFQGQRANQISQEQPCSPYRENPQGALMVTPFRACFGGRANRNKKQQTEKRAAQSQASFPTASRPRMSIESSTTRDRRARTRWSVPHHFFSRLIFTSPQNRGV